MDRRGGRGVWEPEPETVDRARAGDVRAFEELVRGSLPDAHRYASHLLRDRQTAEDVVQEAYLEAYRSLHRFRGESKFSTWLFRIVRHRAVDAIRRASRRERLAEHLPAARAQPDAAARTALHLAIDGLPPELRETFITIEVFGLTYREAGPVLGVPPGTVKSRMHRTRRLLVDALSEEDADEV